MTKPSYIVIELLSDTTISRGEGTAGIVDIEIEHDCFGMPFLGGKTLRGLLRDTWLSMQEHFTEPEFVQAAGLVFGPPSDVSDTAILAFGDAVLEETTRKWIMAAQTRDHDPIPSAKVLNALTAIRSQTSEDRKTGAPAQATLRSSRVILQGLRLFAPLHWLTSPNSRTIQCLSLSVLGTRHVGLCRNRGRGFVRMTLDDNIDRTRQWAMEKIA
jgi:hypothetical protein